MLPLYGGGYQVWTTCLLIFQAVLLLGYLYADLVPRRLPAGRFLQLHAGLLALSALLLPSHFPVTPWLAQPAADMALRLLAFAGAPLFLLSATATTAQAAYARTARGREPYEIYGWSNLGSAAGLLAYPFGFAVAFELGVNLLIWRALFLLFILAVLPLLAAAPAAESEAPRAARVRTGVEPFPLLWFLLPAASSAALAAATNYMNTVVAPMPLTWVFPLLVYLFSFAAYFVENRFAPRMLPAALGASVLAALALTGLRAPQGVMIVAVVNMVLGLACLLLHRELHALRPRAAALPRYFLAIAAGGFCGTALIMIVLPLLARHAFARYADLDAALILFAACAAMLFSPRLASGWRKFAVAGAALAGGLLISARAVPGTTNVYSLRNFYGVYQINDDPALGLRTMSHGGTPHGVQALDPSRRSIPLSYYGPNSPIASIFALRPGADVGVVGLGVGGLMPYARPGERWTVFELDPDVVSMAREQFTFVADSRAPTRMVIGDSRIQLAQEPPAAFDLLILDAFNGASIPSHLLTREAMVLYRSRLKDGGLLAVHCSSNHFALKPVLAAGAAAAGMKGWSKDSSESSEGGDDGRDGLHSSEWFVATADASLGARLGPAGWSEETPDARDLWTDGYKNVFRALRFR